MSVGGTRTDGVVRLHVGPAGTVWCGTPGTPAGDSGLSPWEFFSGRGAAVLDGARAVRLLGAADNAPLVLKLRAWQAGSPAAAATAVELWSPGQVPAAWLADDPAAVVRHLWQPAGGVAVRHAMTPADAATYAMIDARGNPGVVRRLAEQHPAWAALTFVGRDADAGCRLLCDIVDPRWFRHPVRPGRWTRLYAYLGVVPRTVAAVVAGAAGGGRHFNRAANAVGVWYNQGGKTDHKGYLAGVAAAAASEAAGVTAATRRLVSLVATTWVAAAARPHPELAFDAVRFFGDAKTARAYERHVAGIRD